MYKLLIKVESDFPLTVRYGASIIYIVSFNLFCLIISQVQKQKIDKIFAFLRPCKILCFKARKQEAQLGFLDSPYRKIMMFLC